MALTSPAHDATATAPARCVAIGLVSAGVLLLQICLTRILSVLLWYHFAFFAISLAMVGVGAPGVWLALVKPKAARLNRALLGAGVLVPLGLGLMIQLQHHFGSWAIVFCLGCMVPGALSLGTAVCLLLLAAPGASIGRLYAYDLLGACLGALAVVPAMSVVPTPLLAGAVGLLPLAACLLVAGRRERLVAFGLGVTLLGMLAWGQPFQIRHTKEYAEQGLLLTPIYEKWTPTARLTVFDHSPWPEGMGFRWGMGGKVSAQPAPGQYWLEQDASAGTPIIEGSAGPAALDYLLYDVVSVGYQLRQPKHVAIVGAGGGRDIWTARLAGAETIDAIELNAGIVAALRGRFARYAGGVYDLPGVRAIVGEGRSVLSQARTRYDLIQLSMIDSWAATAAGAYALAENNLYTVEAYRLYYSRLSDTGLVSTSRWMPNTLFGFELPRLVVLVEAALAAEGVAEPKQHIAVVHAGLVGTVLMSRDPFSPTDVDAIDRVCAERGFVRLLPEGSPTAPPSSGRPRWRDPDVAALAKTGLVLSPPTDDKPFFFQMASPLHAPTAATVQQTGVNAQSVVLLRRLMLIMGGLTLVLFFLPFALSRWLPRAAGFWRGSAYFTAIGLGFMLLEIAWLQRFVLYLGHPSRATTAALASLLLGAGLGSMLSGRLRVAQVARAGWIAAVGAAALNASLSSVVAATLGWPLGARIAITCALLVPIGVVMGCFFPLGMVRFGESHRPWFWALNGAASVLASVASLALAMELGLSAVAYLGAGIYVAAWLLFLVGPRVAPSS